MGRRCDPDGRHTFLSVRLNPTDVEALDRLLAEYGVEKEASLGLTFRELLRLFVMSKVQDQAEARLREARRRGIG